MVTDVERDYLWSTYATDPRARLNLGIRRRLASLMEGDRRKIELMNSLLLSLPGTPIIYYGDEIGMGDNIYLGDRNGVRTPMQWTPDRNGGFSRCDPARLYSPPVMDPVFGYEAVNVEAQSRSLASLLSWTKRMIAVRKSSKVFGYGSLAFLRPSNRAVFAYVREHEGEVLLCVANLSRSAQAAEIDLSAWRGWTPMEMLGHSEFPPIREEPYLVTLAPYGFLWFRLTDKPEHREILPRVPEFATLVLTPGRPLLQARTRAMFEREVLPVYLARARWFADKGARQIRAHVKTNIPVIADGGRVDVTLVEVASPHATANYIMPLAVRWSRFDRERDKPNAVGAVRQGPREGTLFDVAAQDEWISLLLNKICASETVEAEGRRLEFRPSTRLTPETCAFDGPVRAVDTEQSNSTALVGEKLVVKLFRRLAPGVNPEIEIGRFLTDVVGFANSPALLGAVELVEGGGERSSIAVVHEFIGNQGEAWTVTSAYLERFVEEQRLLPSEDAAQSSELAAYQRLMAQIGLRLAQMQIALASRDDVPDFSPAPITGQDSEAWIEAIMARAAGVRERLAAQRAALSEPDRVIAEQLLDAMGSLDATLRGLIPRDLDACKIRTHGDFHLGQVLTAKDDVFIIDFEGEPNRTIAQRRAKGPAARDVAGLVRSIDYATTAALERALANAPDEQGRLAPALAIWRDVSAATFVAAYREALSDVRLWPRQREDADRLLDLFLIDKALYEIEYELSHRPQWVRVPLAGILRILSARQEAVE
jgi:maltose alpha-D-glucosyltransferase/alpha-amylase